MFNKYKYQKAKVLGTSCTFGLFSGVKGDDKGNTVVKPSTRNDKCTSRMSDRLRKQSGNVISRFSPGANVSRGEKDCTHATRRVRSSTLTPKVVRSPKINSVNVPRGGNVNCPRTITSVTGVIPAFSIEIVSGTSTQPFEVDEEDEDEEDEEYDDEESSSSSFE